MGGCMLAHWPPWLPAGDPPPSWRPLADAAVELLLVLLLPPLLVLLLLMRLPEAAAWMKVWLLLLGRPATWLWQAGCWPWQMKLIPGIWAVEEGLSITGSMMLGCPLPSPFFS